MSNDPNDDPFAPEADPYREEGAVPFGRRTLMLAALAAPLVSLASCSVRRLACAPMSGSTEACAAKFCRYYGGSKAPEGGGPSG